MPDSGPLKMDPRDLSLRAAPRAVTRLSRRVLIAGAAIFALLVCGALWWALGIRPLRLAGGPELYNTDGKLAGDALNGLPKTYADFGRRPEPVSMVVPRLPAEPRAAPVLPSAAGDDPLARARQQAAQSNVFFTVSANPPQISAALPVSAGPPYGAGATASIARPLDADTAQNLQDHKTAFVNSRPDTAIYSPQHLETPRSPYQLMAGTMISAALVTGLNSDLPGQVIAQVTEDVYDSVSGRYLLVPQGSRLLGRYDSSVAYGQKRVLLIWTRLLMPDGTSIVLDNLPATDAAGYSGLEDEVDPHTWQLIKGVALATVLGISSEMALNQGSTNRPSIIIAGGNSLDNSANQAGQRLVSKELAVQPTLTVRPGFPVRVIVNRDIVLKPYAR
jgi:type IV secretion system protein TrbI